jgi:hypothetical protein
MEIPRLNGEGKRASGGTLSRFGVTEAAAEQAVARPGPKRVNRDSLCAGITTFDVRAKANDVPAHSLGSDCRTSPHMCIGVVPTLFWLAIR